MTEAPEDRAAVRLRHRPVAVHAWQDIVFAHWRHDPASLERLVPRGTRPDVVDGSSWVGLTAYVFRATSLPPFPASRRLGSMTEVTIEIPTVDTRGRRGVTYRTVDTSHVPAIVAANTLLGVPYTFAHVRATRHGEVLTHRSVRHPARAAHPVRWVRDVLQTRRPRTVRPRHDAVIRVTAGDVVDSPLAVDLTTRAGIHARHLAQTIFWQRQHAPLTIRAARLERLEGDLPDAAGVPRLFDRAPDSLLVVDGTTVRYAWGDVVR